MSAALETAASFAVLALVVGGSLGLFVAVTES